MAPRYRAAVAIGAPALAVGALAFTSTPAGGDPVNTTGESFAFTGAPVQFTVPDSVTSLHITAVGAPGGNATFGAQAPGKGGATSADLPVTPGDVLVVRVGGP